MYLPNKYSKCYYNIIDRAKSRVLDEFSERHHIIPKSLGGTDLAVNKVALTAREHFICHLLLPKMLTGDAQRKMRFAIWCMINRDHSTGRKRYKITSRKYDAIKKQFRIDCSITHKGKVVSAATKKKQSESAKRHWENAGNKETHAINTQTRWDNSPDQKKTLSMVARNRWASGELNNNSKRKPCVSPDGSHFESTAAAGKFYKKSPTAIQGLIKRGISGWYYL